jgi:mono/diheme cytochrome c family protein
LSPGLPAAAVSLAALAAWAALAALAFGPAPAVAAAAAAEVQPSVELGRKTYVTSCTRCHGINLVTSSSAHFDLRTFPRDDKPRFMRSVTQGVRAMPAWGSVLKPVQLESLWLYVGSVNGWPVADQTAAAPAAAEPPR